MNLAGLIQPFVGRTGGLIAAMRAVQKQYGHIPAEADAIAADLFNLSRAEVKGVISFYHDFTRAPKDGTVMRLCAAEACQAAGGRALIAEIEKKYAVKMGEAAAAKDLTLEPVYCLGLCSVAPSAMVGDRLVARADAGKIDKALSRARKERAA
ncbi:NAD(P)H-dependent oxidoreductase subunit E [Hyphococcus sp.]|uniref:NAD(P)H-dependent oxidoreductase subunit E n=1 Tax=Hyphococcus sp. TaxID=2038636 RepID=UPI003CCBD878